MTTKDIKPTPTPVEAAVKVGEEKGADITTPAVEVAIEEEVVEEETIDVGEFKREINEMVNNALINVLRKEDLTSTLPELIVAAVKSVYGKRIITKSTPAEPITSNGAVVDSIMAKITAKKW